MKKQSKLTLVGLIVVVCVAAFYLLIIIPGLRYLNSKASRVVCGTNLKGLGTAMTVYGYDYDDDFPQLPGSGPWSKRLGFDYDMQKPDFTNGGAEGRVSRTITASLYLLVREADVSPKSFVCTEARPDYSAVSPRKYSEFDGHNSKNLDMVELWDFGPTPHKHVGYAYHNPYSKYPAVRWLPASFATMADMSPWFSSGDIQPSQTNENAPQVIRITDPSTWKFGNSLNHELKHKQYAEANNVVFADGHVSYEKQPNVGVNNDNIYTFWSTDENPPEQNIQGGTAPTSRSAENDAKSSDDSFLAI